MTDPVDWEAMGRLPEWEVTARLTRTARFRMRAASPDEARAMLTNGENGVRSMEDLYDPGELAIDQVISVEPVGGGDG